MLVAVDGTAWSVRTSSYMNELSGSFVWQVHKEHKGPKEYLRGPTVDGLSCSSIAGKAADTAADWVGRYPGAPLFFAGYSRGGAICIEAAKLLREKHITIACLALFDAVDRTIMINNVQALPGNVEYCCHALRNYNNEVMSRPSFSNCGLIIEPPGKLETKRFRATHAALGGLPWAGDHPVESANAKTKLIRTITEAEDRIGAAQVHEWMWSKMQLAGML